MLEKANWNVKWIVERWLSKEDQLLGKPSFLTTTFFDNCLLNAGIDLMEDLICAAGGQGWDNSNAYICVGDNEADIWVADTAYSKGDRVKDTPETDSNIYECTTAGTSDSTEPTWNTDEGDTTEDNTVTWTTHTQAAAAAQTHCNGANQLVKGMEDGYPTHTSQKMSFKSSFASGEGNYAWGEFAVVNGDTLADQVYTDTHMNRKVSAQGTKAAGQVWTVTLEITLS